MNGLKLNSSFTTFPLFIILNKTVEEIDRSAKSNFNFSFFTKSVSRKEKCVEFVLPSVIGSASNWYHWRHLYLTDGARVPAWSPALDHKTMLCLCAIGTSI